MKESNVKKLLTDFPNLYRGMFYSRYQTCMDRSFECGDGWFNLIYNLSTEIEIEARALGLDPVSESWPMALQVKEKFWTMRFYMICSERIHERIMKAESESSMICMNCGQPRTSKACHITCDFLEDAERSS